MSSLSAPTPLITARSGCVTARWISTALRLTTQARVFPNWKGAKLSCARSRKNSYWFLAVRADLDVRRGDLLPR